MYRNHGLTLLAALSLLGACFPLQGGAPASPVGAFAAPCAARPAPVQAGALAHASDSVPTTITAFGKARAAGFQYGPRGAFAVYEFYSRRIGALQEDPPLRHYSLIRGGIVWNGVSGILSESVGLQADYAYHYVFWSGRVARGGESLSLHAGPGLTLGFVQDGRRPLGLMAGVTGDFGADLRLGVPLVVSLDWSASWAYHLARYGDDDWRVRNFRNGWRRAYLPSVSLKYDLQDRRRRGGEARFHRFTYGFSCLGVTSFLNALHCNFFNDEGSRIDLHSREWGLHVQGSFLLHAGVNLGERWNLSLLGGYDAPLPGVACWPLSLRGSYFFVNSYSPGAFVFLDGGAGLSGKGMLQRLSLLGKLGGGYRIPTGSKSALDFHGALRVSRAHPLAVTDPWTSAPIQRERLNRSDANIVAVEAGFSLSF